MLLIGQAFVNLNLGSLKTYAYEQNELLSKIGITQEDYSENI